MLFPRKIKKISMILASIIAVAVLLFFFSQSALGRRIGLDASIFQAIRTWLLGSPNLSAADYKDGTIILVKPVATGVGEGRYEAGDIVEIRDGEELYQKFGNGNFLGAEERTMLLPLYYPGRLSEEQKQMLLEPEYSVIPSVIPAKAGIQDSGSPIAVGDDKKPEDQKMTKRRQSGVDYTQFLSDSEIIKVRQFSQLKTIPEIDLSVIIDKKTGVSFNENSNFETRISNQIRSSKLETFGLENSIIKKLIQNSKFKIQNYRQDSVVRLPKRLQFAEKIIAGVIPGLTRDPGLDSGSEAGMTNKEVVHLSWHLSFAEKAISTAKWLAKSIAPPAIAQVTETIKVVDPGNGTGADYVSLNAWEGAMQDNLVSTSTPYISVAKCRATNGVADQVVVTISGWTTDATHYIKIWTDPNESYRHSGKWDSTKYRLEMINSSAMIGIGEDYVRIDGLQFKATHDDGGDYRQVVSIAASSVFVSNSIVNIIIGDGSVGIRGFNNGSSAKTAYFYNNIIFGNRTDQGTGILTGASGAFSAAYNNTVFNLGVGINASAGTTLAKNNISYGNGSNYEGDAGWVAASTNNLSGPTQNDAPGSNPRNAVMVIFADASSSDFRLAESDTGAKDWGVNLTSDIYLSLISDIEGQTRSGSWDIGADEFRPTEIYRSVGPSNTAAIASSTGATLTISGSTASFSSGMPTNMGVGDVIVYQSLNGTGKNSLAFVHGRTSATQYTVKDVAGHIASSTSATTNWQVFRAYISLSNAEAGTENTGIPASMRNFDTFSGGKNLASSTEAWNIACYGDAADTTAVTINGWTTTADNYIKIYTPYLSSEVGTSQRHNGKWDDTKHRLVVSGSYYPLLVSNTPNVKIYGLQVEYAADTGFTAVRASGYTGDENIEVAYNIIRSTVVVVTSYGIRIDAGTSDHKKVFNNIVYGFTRGILTATATNKDAQIYNNTVYECTTYGFDTGYQDTIAKNNISYNNTDNYSGTWDASSTNNLSGPTQADAPGSNAKNGATVQFVDEANKDFHLALGDGSARNMGANLRNDANLAFSDDIDGESRPETGPWDIGADEVTHTTQINTPLSGRFIDSSLVGYWSFDGANMDWSQTSAEARDVSGNANHGDIVGMGKEAVADGISGQALSFDGVDDYVNLGDSTILDGATAYTMSAWVKFDTRTGNILRKWVIPQTSFLFAVNNTDEIQMVAGGSNGGVLNIMTTGLNLNVNQWYFLTAVWSGGNNGQVYANGVPATMDIPAIATGPDNILNSSEYLAIGARYNSGSPDGFLDGLIDEVRIYNRALSASEIAEQYRAGAATMKVNTPTSGYLTSGLVGHWTFDGQDTNWTSATAGTTADKSGNNNTGTMTNMSRSGSVADGISGQALSFDGCSGCAKDDYVNAGSAAILDNMENITISAWIKPNTGGTDFSGASIADKNIGSGLGWSFYTDNTRYLEFNVNFIPTDVFRRSNNNVLNFNTWQHVAATYSSSTLQTNIHLYVNGVETGYQSGNDAVGSRGNDSEQNLFIGQGMGTDNFDGLIDEVRVYNRVLSPSEIQELYNLGGRKVKFKQ